MQEWMDWFNANAFQAISSIVIAILTIALIGATFWYAWLTRRMLRVQEQQLERQWRPHGRFQLKKVEPNIAELKLFNYGPSAVEVTNLLIKREETNACSEFPLYMSVRGEGGEEVVDIAQHLLKSVGLPPGSHDGVANLRIGIHYHAVGAFGLEGYYGYRVNIRNCYVHEIAQLTLGPSL